MIKRSEDHLQALRACLAAEIADAEAEISKKTRLLQQTDVMIAQIGSNSRLIRPKAKRNNDQASEKQNKISETLMDMFRMAKEPLARTDIVSHIADTLQITASDDIKRLSSAVYQVLNRYDVERNAESGVLRKVGNGRNIKWERIP